MKQVVPLERARDTSLFGSKAVGLGGALRDQLPVPPGFAISGDLVDAIAAGDREAILAVEEAVQGLTVPLAVRSSAVDEDGTEASFAGQHLTRLNVPTTDGVASAVREIWWSANSDSAISYRQRLGVFTRPSVGVVVQTLLDPEVAGVMFTDNPITGADERLIEATWGLGEAVVAGRVIPDHFRIDPSGEVLERRPGRKSIAIRPLLSGGTHDEEIPADRAEQPCLSDVQLGELHQLALRCEAEYGPGRDIEWAFAGGTLYLLQCRAVTTGKAHPKVTTGPARGGASIDALRRVPLFSGLDQGDLTQVARLFKERHFAPGETAIREGSGGSAFYLIDSGEAVVSVRGEEVRTLGPGEYFGEISLIDEGPRSATVTAKADLNCYGLTFWDFQPLVKGNGEIGWKLLLTMAKMLRAAQPE